MTDTTNTNQPPKKYPAASDEVASMLGMQTSQSPAPSPAHSSHPVADLPIHEPAAAKSHDSHETAASEKHEMGHFEHAEELEPADEHAAKQPFLIRAVKTILPYAAVFAVGLFLYYFFFTGVNFSSLLRPAPKAVSTKEMALETLEKQNLAAYQSWMGRYYYYVSDTKVLDPDADNSGNGFTNFQKFLLKLNPKTYDTLGLGMADSQAVAMGINPLTGLTLTEAQKEILNKYIDMEVVSNRLALSQIRNNGAVAGTSLSTTSNPAVNPVIPPVNNPPPVYIENENAPAPIQPRGSEISNPSSGGNSQNRPTNSYEIASITTGGTTPPINTNSGVGNRVNGVPVNVIDININTEIPGRLEIPDLKINVPIMWSKNAEAFEGDLKQGVVHYPGTALPGQIGTTYIAGHSSGYLWSKGSYNQVFSRLGDLPNNTSFKITVVRKDGKDTIFHYVVIKSQEYLPTDQEQFKHTGKSLVALSTCWPVGSMAKRLVVFGELIRTE